MEPQDRTVVQLLSELHVTIPFGVETGRLPATTRPALEVLVPGQAGELTRSRKYFAQSGTAQLAITRDQMTALRRGGAPGDDVEVLRSFKNAQNVTFSDHCPGCQRWIHLGGIEREGQCFCGQVYRVAFDLTPDDWSLARDMRCMDCGAELTRSLVATDLNPWRAINGHQVQCDGCARKRAELEASSSRPRLTPR
ncbi:MAG: hypothetical protein JWM82_3176 [Myxococcales bacterium]|jgi:hypothetical protein|nr:hypothetical protein [Myxococcales bacterium]